MIGFSFDKNIIQGDVLWRKEVISNKDDPTQITWVGDYSNGQMQFKNDPFSPAQVSEHQLESKFYDRLFRKYSFEEVLRGVLSILSKNRSDDETNEVRNLLNFYQRNEQKLQEEIEYFKNSNDHEFISKDEFIKKMEGQFAT